MWLEGLSSSCSFRDRYLVLVENKSLHLSRKAKLGNKLYVCIRYFSLVGNRGHARFCDPFPFQKLGVFRHHLLHDVPTIVGGT